MKCYNVKERETFIVPIRENDIMKQKILFVFVSAILLFACAFMLPGCDKKKYKITIDNQADGGQSLVLLVGNHMIMIAKLHLPQQIFHLVIH